MKNNQFKKSNYKEEKNYDDQVEGRNSVIELLESGKDINKIFIAKGEKHGSINKIIAMAKENRVVIRRNGTNRKLSRSYCNCTSI